MLSNPTKGRRLTGRVAVVAAIAVALPLTATRAIHYIDVPMVNASEPQAIAPVKAPLAVAAVDQPAKLAAIHQDSSVSIDEGNVTINGRTKRWTDMNPAEKAEVRRSLAQAREELGRVNEGEIQREIREAMEDSRMSREEARRELAEARIEVDQAMREIDAHAADIRRSGQDPEQIKATVRASLKAVEAIDVDAITRQALASVEPDTIKAALAAAQAGLDKAEAEIDRAVDANDRDDD